MAIKKPIDSKIIDSVIFELHKDVVDLSFADAHEDEASELAVYIGYFHKFVPVHFVRIWVEY